MSSTSELARLGVPFVFKLYALREKAAGKAAASRADLEHAMKGKVIEQATLTAKFGR